MACLMKPVANFADLESVRLLLYPGESKTRQSDSHDDVLGSSADNRYSSTLPEKSSTKDSSWLRECQISLSSSTELLVVSRRNMMVVLSTKWNSREESDIKSKFHVTWHGSPCHSSEEITSVLCLPLISQGKSSHCGPDWTCIVVGFSSGYVRFYTENCDLLLSKLLHNEPVKFLKCQTYQTPQYSTSREPTEEIYAVYLTVVCIIPGFGLFQTLRACRNHQARVQANCMEDIPSPPLALKKLGFVEQEVLTDCGVVGKATENTFDHLMTASICGGFNSWYRSSAPQTSLVIASGKKPFVGFHYSLEGGATPVLADVAKVMANKLKSAIGHAVPVWLTGGKKNSNSDKTKEVPLEPTETMECRFGLCDNWRHGDSLVLSPNRNLAAVCDSLGRIILIDNQKGIAVRMWKGYREAQCGWIEAKEERKQEHHSSRNLRTALFLVIYSPKKGIIEIWSMQEGPKIASFAVTKTGRLLYIDYGLMGLNNVQLKGGNNCQSPCIFVDLTGTLREISVPFHFALSAKNSKRARDIHVLKKVKIFIKAEEFDEDALKTEVVKSLGELITCEIQLQALEFLSSHQAITPDVLWDACNVAVEKWLLVSESAESLQVDFGFKSLSEFTKKLQRLVALYRFVYQLNQKPPDYTTVVDSNLNPSVLSEKLLTPQREINIILNLITMIEALNVKNKFRSEGRVTFGDGTQNHFIEFISCFEASSSNQGDFVIGLKKELLDDELKRTSELLYQGTLYSDSSIDEWKNAVSESSIDPSHLMKLALVFWLNRRQGAALEKEMLRFAEILTAICTMADINLVCVESNKLSPWWRDVRSILVDSTNAFMGLTAAIVCRAVALSIEHVTDQMIPKETEMSNANTSDSISEDLEDNSSELAEGLATSAQNVGSEWENVSIDMCQWSLLIGQLEDVALLATVLRRKPPVENSSSRFCIPFTNMDVSLSHILSKGKGSVSELTARWISFSTIKPELLIDYADIEFEGIDNSKDTNSPRNVKNSGATVGEGLSIETGSDAACVDEANSGTLGCISILKGHYPYSLSSSVLLTNVCWEYMLAWHKSFEALEPALEFLQAVPSAVMKQGLCNLVWTMHLKQRFESAVLIIQKVGKVPKEERLIRQEVGVSDSELPQFFDACLRFFDVFMEVICSMDVCLATKFPNRSEELWAGNACGPPSLVELILDQPTANYELVHLHHQLTLALHMLLVHNIKCNRPLSTLFDNTGQAVFFSELSGNPNLPSHNPDRKLLDSRCQFLFRVICAAMQTIRLPNYTSETDETQPDPSTAVNWMSKIYALGAVWGVSSDKLRRHQICELYSSGFDKLAEEIIPAVVDLSLLASQLMIIVGQRLKYIISTSPDLGGKISKLSPTLSTWLDSMVNTLKKNSCPLSDTAQLLVQVLQYLPEKHLDYSLALQMVDAVHSFRDVDDS